ncbi:hypothetical protein JCM19052_1604 [Vibrio sp. JCM 19052]|nr:hypothetical protein JCM19052_1604 [Vibrio sp. JCM 19052]
MRYQVEISKENQLLFKVNIDNINQDKCEASLENVLTKFLKRKVINVMCWFQIAKRVT